MQNAVEGAARRKLRDNGEIGGLCAGSHEHDDIGVLKPLHQRHLCFEVLHAEPQCSLQHPPLLPEHRLPAQAAAGLFEAAREKGPAHPITALIRTQGHNHHSESRGVLTAAVGNTSEKS